VPNSPTFPHLHLLVSGGNSQIIYLQDWQNWQVVGQTLDDAAGECLDKIGRMIGLDYPGGVNLARIAGLEDANYLNFPIGMKNAQKINSKKEQRGEEKTNSNQVKISQESEQNPIKNQENAKSKITKTRKLNSFLKPAKITNDLSVNINQIQTQFQPETSNKIQTEITKTLQNEKELNPNNFSSNSNQNLDKNLEINSQIENQKIQKIQIEVENDQSNDENYTQNYDKIDDENWEKLTKLNLNYSFSGLKTAVRYFVQKQKLENWEFENKLTANENLILQNWHQIQDFLNKSEKIEQKTETEKITIIAQKYFENLKTLENRKKTKKLKTENLETAGFENQNEKSGNLKKDKLKNNEENEENQKLISQNCLQNQTKNMSEIIEKIEIKDENKSEFWIETGKLNLDFWNHLQTQNWTKLELFYKICISGQSAVITQLTTKFELAIKVLKPKSLGISGGVSANLLLREKVKKLAALGNFELFIPPQNLTGDNAVMIALAGLADLWSNSSKLE